jgi:acyl carrier protein
MIGLTITKEEIEIRIKFILDKEFDVDPSIIMPQSRLIEDLGLKAIDTIEFVLHLEEKFGINLDRQMPQLETVGQFASLIERITRA